MTISSLIMTVVFSLLLLIPLIFLVERLIRDIEQTDSTKRAKRTTEAQHYIGPRTLMDNGDY